jgi:hypothetical protein
LIICVEGPSAAGKTTLARALALAHGAVMVPELDAAGAPSPSHAEPWFSERHAERWGRARELTRSAPLVVMDGDPLKGLWYNWIHSDAGWPGVEVIEPQYQSQIEQGALGIPTLYVYLEATEAQLRRRRADDPTRQRRGFETNIRALEPQRRYFAALDAADPGRVAFLETASRESLAGRVVELARCARESEDPLMLLRAIAGWVRTHRAFG